MFIGPILTIAMERRLNKLRNDVRHHLRCIGLISYLHGPAYASDCFGVSKAVAKYWKKKFVNPEWKPNHHGGSKHQFSEDDREAMVQQIWKIVDSAPATPIRDYVRLIQDEIGIVVSASTVRNLLREEGLRYELHLFGRKLRQFLTRFSSWKVPQTKQINKFTPLNMQRYDTFLEWMEWVRLTKDTSRIKFLDEAHFQPKGRSPSLA